MIPGAPVESRWLRSQPRRDWPAAVLDTMIHAAFPLGRILEAHPLEQGRRNANLKLALSNLANPVVIRIYEHDPSLCQKEIDLMRLLKDRVPVPELIHTEPQGHKGSPPFILMRYIEGISFRVLKSSHDAQAIAEGARSAGEILAHIHAFSFSKPGWLGPGPRPTAPLLEGSDAMPRFVDECMASPKLRQRVPAELRDRTHALMWANAETLACLDEERNLVHNDYNKRNLLVRCIEGRWRVAAVLDWEFAVSGSPLSDFGNFLRYERRARAVIEPHFSAGYLEEGGRLPANWRPLARLIDLIALAESLTRDELPHGTGPIDRGRPGSLL
jgi:aminoglycoside phosphotransferase (APT) family kinase protein